MYALMYDGHWLSHIARFRFAEPWRNFAYVVVHKWLASEAQAMPVYYFTCSIPYADQFDLEGPR